MDSLFSVLYILVYLVSCTLSRFLCRIPLPLYSLALQSTTWLDLAPIGRHAYPSCVSAYTEYSILSTPFLSSLLYATPPTHQVAWIWDPLYMNRPLEGR